MNNVTFFPEQASTFATDVDQLFWFFIVACGLGGLITAILTFGFAFFYRRGANRYAHTSHHNTALEIGWSTPIAIVAIAMFAWGAKIYVDQYIVPHDAMEVYVTGKQWMWKIQHPNGKREINELHVPVNTPVVLTLTSEDVIHSFYIPAFRSKKDAVPGRYSRMWFNATKTGTFHLFCAEYCGTDHSRMIGSVYVMSETDYLDWLNEGGQQLVSMAERGAQAYNRYACGSCHVVGENVRGPDLTGIYGQKRMLDSGETVVADEAYLRESILKPNALRVQGFAPIMPTFKAQITEEELNELIAYIREMKPVAAPAVQQEAKPAQAPVEAKPDAAEGGAQ